MPPISHRFVADIDAAFMQQIFHIPKQQRELNVQHHSQTDDLWARFEPLEVAGFGHAPELSTTLPRLKSGFPDKTM